MARKPAVLAKKVRRTPNVSPTFRALALYAQPQAWRQLQATGMRSDLSWQRSARAYEQLYAQALADAAAAS